MIIERVQTLRDLWHGENDLLLPPAIKIVSTIIKKQLQDEQTVSKKKINLKENRPLSITLCISLVTARKFHTPVIIYCVQSGMMPGSIPKT